MVLTSEKMCCLLYPPDEFATQFKGVYSLGKGVHPGAPRNAPQKGDDDDDDDHFSFWCSASGTKKKQP